MGAKLNSDRSVKHFIFTRKEGYIIERKGQQMCSGKDCKLKRHETEVAFMSGNEMTFMILQHCVLCRTDLTFKNRSAYECELCRTPYCSTKCRQVDLNNDHERKCLEIRSYKEYRKNKGECSKKCRRGNRYNKKGKCSKCGAQWKNIRRRRLYHKHRRRTSPQSEYSRLRDKRIAEERAEAKRDAEQQSIRNEQREDAEERLRELHWTTNNPESKGSQTDNFTVEKIEPVQRGYRADGDLWLPLRTRASDLMQRLAGGFRDRWICLFDGVFKTRQEGPIAFMKYLVSTDGALKNDTGTDQTKHDNLKASRENVKHAMEQLKILSSPDTCQWDYTDATWPVSDQGLTPVQSYKCIGRKYCEDQERYHWTITSYGLRHGGTWRRHGYVTEPVNTLQAGDRILCQY